MLEQIVNNPIINPLGSSINYVKNRIADNVDPFGYSNAWERVLEAVNPINDSIPNQESKGGTGEERRDLLHLYMGLDQERNSILSQTQYVPTKGHKEGTTYHSSPYTENEIRNEIYKLNLGTQKEYFYDWAKNTNQQYYTGEDFLDYTPELIDKHWNEMGNKYVDKHRS